MTRPWRGRSQFSRAPDVAKCNNERRYGKIFQGRLTSHSRLNCPSYVDAAVKALKLTIVFAKLYIIYLRHIVYKVPLLRKSQPNNVRSLFIAGSMQFRGWSNVRMRSMRYLEAPQILNGEMRHVRKELKRLAMRMLLTRTTRPTYFCCTSWPSHERPDN